MSHRVSHSLEAVRQLLQKFKAGIPLVESRVFYTTDTDYSEDGINIATQESLPSLYIMGPQETRNALFTTQEKPTIQLPGNKFRRFTAEEATDYSFQVVALANSSMDLLALTEQIHAFFLNGKFIEVERNPGTPGDGKVKYEVDLPAKFVFGRMVNKSNLKEATGTVIIRGVLVSDGEIFEEGHTAEQVNVTAKTI